MTAEVVVMNKQALAIAADSAVTIGRDRDARVFNSAEKLFALSKTQPIGIMFFSAASIMGVPVETVAKSYRKELGTKAFDSLEEYFDDFRKFVATSDTLFSQDEREENCAQQVAHFLEDMHLEVLRVAFTNVSPMKSPKQRHISNIARGIVREHHKAIMRSDEVHRLTARHQKRINRIVRPVVEYWLKLFSRDLHLGRQHLKLLREAAYNLLSHEFPGVACTGVVIAGFGDKDKYPSICSGRFECALDGVFKFSKALQKIENDNIGMIVAFAQRDMVSLFMEGKSVVYERLEKKITPLVIRKAVIENLKISRMSQAKKNKIAADIAKQVQGDVSDALDRAMGEYYIKPIVQTVSGMPKVDLAATAEALVNLTVVKHRASPGHDTVGPPIDVAVISKGDGFIWVKRKHYFDVALNPRYVHSDKIEVSTHG